MNSLCIVIKYTGMNSWILYYVYIFINYKNYIGYLWKYKKIEKKRDILEYIMRVFLPNICEDIFSIFL